MSTTFFINDSPDFLKDLTLNVAMGNVRTILNLLQRPGADPCTGSIPCRELPNILRHLVLLKNLPEFLVEEACPDSGLGTNFVSFGRTPEQVQRYVERLIEICSLAYQWSRDLVWG
jgi:hypothetical protein